MGANANWNHWRGFAKASAEEKLNILKPLYADSDGHFQLTGELLRVLLEVAFIDGALAACNECAAAGHAGSTGDAKWAN